VLPPSGDKEAEEEEEEEAEEEEVVLDWWRVKRVGAEELLEGRTE
jgi:hypothetical protein